MGNVGILPGANRLFLTHSQASEASDQGSIPIIGLATWKSTSKLRSDQPYALFAADFDQGDPLRWRDREWTGQDHVASITGVIDQTLRALREVETLEIARANDIELTLGKNHRWKPTKKLAAISPSRKVEPSKKPAPLPT